MAASSRPEYVTVKNWKTWQHYKDREPPWVKLHSKLLADDGFMGLTEADQWQLVRIWLVAARSSKYTLDGDKRRTPVLSCKEATIRRSIGSTRRVPIDRFIADGWLIPIESKDVFSYTAADETLDDDKHGDSTVQAPLDSTLLEVEKTEELNTTAAASSKSTKSTSSTTAANSAEEPELEHPEDLAAAQESPTEKTIRAACDQFGSSLKIVEPIARQLTAAAFGNVVTKMTRKVKRGSADDPRAHFVFLLQAEISELAKQRAKLVQPPTAIRLPEAERAKPATGEDWVRHIVPTLSAHPFERVEGLVNSRSYTESWTPAQLAERLELARVLHAEHGEPELEAPAA